MLSCVIFLGSSLDVIILLFNFSSNTILELLKLYSVIILSFFKSTFLYWISIVLYSFSNGILIVPIFLSEVLFS